MTPMTSCLSTECKKRLHEGGLLVDEKLEVGISKLHVTLGKTLTSPSLAWELQKHLQSPAEGHFQGESQAIFHKQHHTIRRAGSSETMQLKWSSKRSVVPERGQASPQG